MSGQFEFAVVYGRRRVGKTTLIKEFMKDKNGIYYMSVEGTKRENLTGLSKVFLSGDTISSHTAEFSGFEAVFEHIDKLAGKGERLIIAIDEFPYLAESYPSVSSMIQSHIDQCWKDSFVWFFHELYGGTGTWVQKSVIWSTHCTVQNTSIHVLGSKRDVKEI